MPMSLSLVSVAPLVRTRHDMTGMRHMSRATHMSRSMHQSLSGSCRQWGGHHQQHHSETRRTQGNQRQTAQVITPAACGASALLSNSMAGDSCSWWIRLVVFVSACKGYAHTGDS
jgi:hypothetical protein